MAVPVKASQAPKKGIWTVGYVDCTEYLEHISVISVRELHICVIHYLNLQQQRTFNEVPCDLHSHRHCGANSFGTKTNKRLPVALQKPEMRAERVNSIEDPWCPALL
jgi:hypothetical protein